MDNAKRILFVANSAQIGGGNRSMEILASSLQDQGYECSIVVPGEGRAASFFREQGLRVLIQHLPALSVKKPFQGFAFVIRFFILLKRERTQVVHANSCDAARSIVLCCWLLGVPVVCHVRLLVSSPFYRWVFRGLPKPDLFIFVSHSIRKKIQPVFEESNITSRFVTIHNPVRFSDDALVEEFGTTRNIGMFANFQEDKGHSDFVAMASILHENRPDVRFHLFGGNIGSSTGEQEIKDLVRSKGLGENFTFHGFVDDVIGPMDRMDIIVCPSHEEAFGRTAIEAMSRGKPVVAYAVGGFMETIEDGVNGYLVPPRDCSTLAAKVNELLEDSDFRKRIGQNNKKKAWEKFGVDEHVKNVIREYSSILDGRKKK